MNKEKTYGLVIDMNEAWCAYHQGLVRALANSGFELRGVVGMTVANDTLPYVQVELEGDNGERRYSDLCQVALSGMGCNAAVAVVDNAVSFKSSLVVGDAVEWEIVEWDRAELTQQRGYYDTMRRVAGLGGRRYYLDNIPDEKAIIMSLANMTKEKILVLKSIWPARNISSYRYVYEIALSRAAEELSLEEGWGYLDLYVAILEYFADRLGKTRFKTYDYEQLREQVLTDLNGYKKEQPFEIALEMIIRL